jgi:hypothetical protein
MTHTPECQAFVVQYAEAVRRFEEQYPQYCRTCEGWGRFEYAFDPSPPGVALSPGYLTEVVLCNDCEGRGLCALCRTPLDEAGTRGCGCPDEGYPAAPECLCWLP